MSEFRILLIDDEPAQIISIKSFLKRRNYSVISANSGSEGMAVIRDSNIDLVFTDFRMPDMNGLEVVKALKDFNPEIPVVVMT
ncbi:MAG: response regulator, partial [Calditrichales bacterium]|nr:response regulator [Calditrichales bacterium]